MNDLIPDFDDISISTTTVIARTNLEIDLQTLFHQIPVFELEVPRTLKKKTEIENYILSLNAPEGSVITVEYKNQLRGFKIKKRKQWVDEPKTTKKYFRNAVTVVMILSGKFINVKIPHKGKLQITGCKKELQACKCVEFLWSHLKKIPKSFMVEGNEMTFTIRTVMSNIVFNIGFDINREKLDEYINKNTHFHSLLETSFGSPGVNIKKPFKFEDKFVSRGTYRDEGWVYDTVSYSKYLNMLTPKEKSKEINKKRNNTFIIFYSGSAIMSGMKPEYMRGEYNEFVSILRRARNDIESVF